MPTRFEGMIAIVESPNGAIRVLTRDGGRYDTGRCEWLETEEEGIIILPKGLLGTKISERAVVVCHEAGFDLSTKEGIGKAFEERMSIIRDYKEKEEERGRQLIRNAECVVATTGDLRRDYEIVDICFGFAKDRAYLVYYQDEAMQMMKLDATLKGCDAITNVRFLMMEGESGGSGGGSNSIAESLFGAVIDSVVEVTLERAVFKKQIPKDGIIVYGTGVKYVD